VQEVVLETRGLVKAFGGFRAVDGVDLRVEQGELRSIIGPNGAGKTTLFNCISATLKPTAGQVIYRGSDITGLPLRRIAHLGIGRAFQITNVFPSLSALENVRLAAQALGGDSFRFWVPATRLHGYIDKAMACLATVGLEGRAAFPAAALSHGDKRKLEIAILLAGDPRLLLLDEPAAGMATEQVPELMKTIAELRRSGERTLLLVEHNVNLVMAISDRITVMHQGRVLAEGTPAEIKASEAVQNAYLGTS